MNRTCQVIVRVLATYSLGLIGLPLGLMAQSGVSVEARGIRVVGAGAGDDSQDSVRPFNWSEGTTVALLLQRAEGGIIDIDRDASSVTSFEDNVGTDLLKESKQGDDRAMFSSQSGFGSMPQINKDSTAAMLELSGPRVPAKGATALKVEGVVMLVCASTKEHFTQALDLKVGSRVTVGPVPLEITKVGKPDWGDAALAVTFTATQRLDTIARMSFALEGESVETRDAGQTSMQAFGTVKVEKTVNFDDKIDAATIELDAWTDLRRVKVPFEVTIGLGL